MHGPRIDALAKRPVVSFFQLHTMNALTQLTARRSRLAVGWFLSTAAALALAGLCSLLLGQTVGETGPRVLSAAFLTSTALLAVVSWQLVRAEHCAVREKQPALRVALGVSLAAAILFLAVQGVALSLLLAQRVPVDDAIGPRAFVFVVVALHALHATGAVFWLVYVTLRGLAGGYDHEYRFGLTACGWCWHALGVAWFAVLFAFAIAM